MTIEMNLYDTLKEIYFSLDDGDRNLLSKFNLTVPRFYIIKHIAENPGVSFTELSVMMLSDKSNITRLIKAIESDGLVVRERHETDGRTWNLYLSNQGKELLKKTLMAHDEFTQARFERVNGDLTELIEKLQNLKHSLEHQIAPHN